MIKVRRCYIKQQRHRVAHEVITGPGYRHMSLVKWLKVIKLRLKRKERLSVNSLLLVRIRQGNVVPMTGAFIISMDKAFAPVLG